MPGRSIQLVNNEIYHVFNRGSDKRDIFLQPKDYKRFLLALNYYQYVGPKPKLSRFLKNKSNSFLLKEESKMVEIICYCLMPNHFHLVIRQLKENGISIFLSHLFNSYTKYFNTKYHRVGALLQGVFKSVLVESDSQLIHLTRYIHLNPLVSELTDDLEHYNWSSYQEYLGIKAGFCKLDTVMSLFSSPKKYKEFVEDYVDYARSIHIVRYQLLDVEN